MTGSPWSETQGLPPHAVLVFEHTRRKGTIYLRWWNAERTNKRGEPDPNWEFRSLRRTLAPTSPLVDEQGRPLKGKALERALERHVDETKAWARQQALDRYLILTGKKTEPTAATPTTPAAPLGILAGLAKAIDAQTGKYPVDNYYRRAIIAAVTHAASVWGNDFPWDGVRRAQWTAFWRQRMRDVRAKGKPGYAAARHAVMLVHAVAQWLRDHELVDAGAAVLASSWLEDLQRDFRQIAEEDVPEPTRHRYTLEESRAILAKAASVDPRLHLALSLGAELRGGQVLRAMRSDLVLDGPDAGTHGTFKVRGRGKKQGVTKELTRGERAAVDQALGDAGYLRELEARYRESGTDYRLFPPGRLRLVARASTGKTRTRPIPPVFPAGAPRRGLHLAQRTLAYLFEEAEAAAKVPRVAGRGPYGIRRAAVDKATTDKVSPEALQQLGGWADRRTADEIYRDQALVIGRTEARDARARFRGEEESE